jgi:hypothetical protein
MNHKFVPVVAAFLILGMLLTAIPLSVAQVYAIGPQLGVVTIAQDDQELGTGIIILGISPDASASARGQTKLVAEYKLVVTYNGATLQWQIGTPGPSVVCNILQKDKVNVIPDPKTGLGKQGSWENLMTTLVDVSNKFVCKPRWKTPFGTSGVYESVGVLDVYFVGPLFPAWIADNIVTVEAFFTAGRTVVFGSDIQDLCTLGWAVDAGAASSAPLAIATAVTYYTLPDGVTLHYVWPNAMGDFHSCESLALAERDVLGITLATGQDPLAPTS